jgi:hypothetical protein
MVDRMAVTTIQVQTETRDLLKKLGDKGKTYDEIIHDLVETYESYTQMMLDRLEESSPETTRPAEEIFNEVGEELRKRRK